VNPFFPFTPVSNPNFVNRERELKAVLDRVPKLGHTAIVGNPHIGKTSLLRQLALPAVFLAGVPQPENYALVEIDFQLFGESKSPNDFWHEVLSQAADSHPEIAETLKPLLKKKRLDEQALYRMFQALAKAQKRVVVLADEFDHLFNLERFRTLEFMGVLRVIAMKSGGLVLVTASRLSVAEMNAKGAEYKVATRGSDLFNYLLELPLGGFDEAITRGWLKQHLPAEAVDEALILAGYHPLLLQLAGQSLFDAIEQGRQPKAYPALREMFTKQAESQFQDVWRYLSDKAQIALVIFALHDLEGQAGRKTFNLERADETLTWYQAEVKEMARRGTLEILADGRYALRSYAFRVWLVENKIVGTRGDEPREAFTKWLHDKQFKAVGLTNEEVDQIQKVLKSVPAGVIDLVKKLMLPKDLQ